MWTRSAGPHNPKGIPMADANGVTRMWCHECQHLIARTSNGDRGHRSKSCSGAEVVDYSASDDRGGSPLLTADDADWLRQQRQLATPTSPRR